MAGACCRGRTLVVAEPWPNWQVFAPVALVVAGALFALVLDALVEVRRHRAPDGHPPSRRGPVLALVSTGALVAAGISAAAEVDSRSAASGS